MTLKSTLSICAFAAVFIYPLAAWGQQTTASVGQTTTSADHRTTTSAVPTTSSASQLTTSALTLAVAGVSTASTVLSEISTSPVLATAPMTTGSVTTASRPVRFNYDLVRPDQDTTSQPLSEVTAVSDSPARDKMLADALVADDYRESHWNFTFYRNLAPGNTSEIDAGRPFESTRQSRPGPFSRQPVGPLTGRIIFASAGHGWTNDSTSTTLWYTQRPNTFGVVEDFGNLDQMNFYADICFRAGATIVPLRPIGFQHVERIIDNESPHATFHGAWADSESTVSFGFAGARVPYRFSRAAAEETAVARFRPVLPVTDEYPVYAWARAGADRVLQTYRVVHAGGVSEVDIDHRKVGNGWIYLGTYPFRQGSSGYVEIPNMVRDATAVMEQRVIIADAIRFGNGMGDVNRGGGISGFPREEEASRYWIERSLPAGAPPLFNAFEERNDQSNNVGAAPRFSAFMNRESEGSFFDRVYMSFHSNAVGGRGVMGLYNSHAQLRPDHQIELAKLTADELNKEMTGAGLNLLRPWHVRGMRTLAHINFGEIRRDYLNNEMSATILEVAFHDNPDDAALLRQYSVRYASALSAYRATVRYLAEVGEQEIQTISPPHAPKLLAVNGQAATGSVIVKWTPAALDPLSSPTTEIRYQIYTSPDGLAFGTGQEVGNVTQFELPKQDLRRPLYVRVTAVSPGGESQPSNVMGVTVAPEAPVLIVHAAGTVEDDMVLTQTAEANLGWALRPGGSFTRLVPRLMNNGEQVRATGTGLRTLGAGFDTIDVSELHTITDLNRYRAIAVMMGRRAVAESLTTTDVLTSLHDYVTTGGRLLISGARLAEVDNDSTESLVRWGDFAEEVLRISFAEQTTVTRLVKAGERDLTTVTLQIGDRNLRYFEPRPTEVLVPGEGGRPVLAYDRHNGAAAVATLKDGSICTAVLGFPLEELEGRDQQAVLAAQIFVAMGLKAPEPPSRPGRRPRGAEEDTPTTTPLTQKDVPTTASAAVTTPTVTTEKQSTAPVTVTTGTVVSE